MLLYGVLLKAEPKALQMLLGHAKMATTYDIYAEAEQSMQQLTAETIDEFITYLTYEGTSEDMEALFKKIQELDLNTLEESTVKIFKQELIRLANIPKLEEQVKDIILELSKTGQGVSANQDSQLKLDLIYSLLSTLDQFKTQTRNIKRNTGYNNNYEYTFNYLQTTQNLLQIIHNANKCKENQTIQPVQIAAIDYRILNKPKTCGISQFQLK